MRQKLSSISVGVKFSAVVLVLGVLACSTSAYAQGNALTYDPADKTFAGTAPFGGGFGWVVTSPGPGRGDPTAPISVPAELILKATAWPEATTEAVALSLVSLDATSIVFSDYNQPRKIGITVTVPSGTPVGDYAYELKAQTPPASEVRPKFGNGDGTILNVNVAAPTVTDITPPNVSFNAPLNGDVVTYCIGGNTIGVTVTAADPESVVTAIFASVNGSTANVPLTPTADNPLNTNTVVGNGSFLATGVGNYTLKAWATSAGGTSDPDASVIALQVQYNLGWLPPISLGKTVKGGSTVPIKFRSTDCLGTFVPDQRVNVKAFKGTPTAPGTKLMDAVVGETATSVRISELDEHYIVNFQTQSGASDYFVQVFFNGVLHATKTFSAR